MHSTKNIVGEIFKSIPRGKVISTIHDAGLSVGPVYKWRNGKACPTFDNLQALANAAGFELTMSKAAGND